VAEALSAVVIVGITVVAAGFLWIALDDHWTGQDKPDYEPIASELKRYRAVFKGRPPAKGDELDLSGLNKGDWRTACLVGGYNNYMRVMKDRDPVDWTFEMRGFVDEFEMALAYVDTAGNPHVMHFKEGIGSDGQHFKKCISKPEMTIPLAWS
jgi:hypothetical protein